VTEEYGIQDSTPCRSYRVSSAMTDQVTTTACIRIIPATPLRPHQDILLCSTGTVRNKEPCFVPASHEQAQRRHKPGSLDAEFIELYGITTHKIILHNIISYFYLIMKLGLLL
jgi:hypothetical protein